MSKRASNEGSVFQRKSDGLWVASVTHYAGGKRLRRAYYAPTQSAALERLKAARKSLDEGLPMPSEQLTVAVFLKEWLDGKRSQLRPESFRRYGDTVRLHLTPELGRISLTRLTPANIQAAYGRFAAKGLSGSSIQLIHGVLRLALKDATRWGRTQRNVADLVDAPRRTTPEMRALAPDEAARLLDAAKGDALEAFYVLAATCGLRLGELQALRWGSLDLERRRLQVTATLQGFADRGRPVFAEPKTTRSKRIVHLPAVAVDALRQHRTRQLEQRLLAGGAWEDFDLVFTTGRGHPLDGNNVRTRCFAPLLARAGLPPMRFHGLRHTASNAAHGRRGQRKGCVRDARPRRHCDDASHLQPCPAAPAGRRGRRDGPAIRARLRPVATVVATVANRNALPALDLASGGRWFLVETGENRTPRPGELRPGSATGLSPQLGLAPAGRWGPVRPEPADALRRASSASCAQRPGRIVAHARPAGVRAG